ncbi:MAG: hypothetical protein L0271_09600 [Gemmatimonadetes bacterium]|nr:hypothetical protein [Gemmatimonadota bacterium]
MPNHARRRHILTLAFAITCSAAMPPSPVGAQAATTAAEARVEDVGSIDAIMAAVYDVISGPAGAPRDWDRFRSLFHPSARLIPTGPTRDGPRMARALTPDEYAARSGPVLERDGFFEVEIARRIEQFGSIVHAFSTYESRRTASPDEKPFMRGINSFQLVNDGTRWWVLTILWQQESPEVPIPAKYLSGGRGSSH